MCFAYLAQAVLFVLLFCDIPYSHFQHIRDICRHNRNTNSSVDTKTVLHVSK